MVFVDPVTQQRIAHDPMCVDLQYDLIGDDSISQETVPVIGNWADYTGSAIVNSRAQQMWAGTSNALFGEDPQIESNAKVGNLGIVGQNTQTTRRRTIRRLACLKK